ncbi:aldo/keto reductase [Endozoicomonas sp. SCSIO W0465]|uniref:aldo/keto reductase n=1 Tax=Endozoicomonas sp. SCSIO W0465 TaxID=2918516 RepID=UPI00207666BC|nr:aldo/keto reductase [Endozoicomonas sp. SCSIO W0465]USE35367.1 aldo/keto reductase [Endozoicomonas sp. SCSIO W0465]
MSKRLGRKRIAGTDLDVSPLGFGTVKFGRDQGVKYPEHFAIPDDREMANLLTLAHDLGMNLLDTAPAYGTSEERLGQLFARYKGLRKQWVICSKVGEEFVTVENGQGRSHFDFSEQHIRFSVERSLKRLNTDVIELMLVHSSGDDVGIIEQTGCLDVLSDLKKEGKILASGMSTKTVAGGILALKHSDVAMVTYNLNVQGEKPVLDFALAHGKGIFIKKAFASGHACLPGHLAAENPVLESMKLVFSHSAVSSAIVGSINPAHMQQNVEACLEACLS